jgi:hypothetical protein
MDLYAFCLGDPLNMFDADGRGGALGTFFQGVGHDFSRVGNNLFDFAVRVPVDTIGMAAYSVNGNPQDFQAWSQTYQGAFRTDPNTLQQNIVMGTVTAEANTLTLGYVSVWQGTYQAASTGNYAQLQNAFAGIAVSGTVAWTVKNLPSSTYRGDVGVDGQTALDNGIEARGDDMDLNRHVNNNEDSGYVPTSKSPAMAQLYAENAPEGTVFEIKSSRGVDINEQLGEENVTIPQLQEVAIPGPVTGSEIVGYYKVSNGSLFDANGNAAIGESTIGDFVSNPYFGFTANVAAAVAVSAQMASASASSTAPTFTTIGKKGK